MRVVIPAAGKSSRYNSEKPKYLLTHPSGLLMIEIVLLSIIKRVTDCQFSIVILHEHDLKFDASEVLRQIALSNNISLDVIILKNITSGPAETIYKCLKQASISGPFLIKDSDNVIDFDAASINLDGCDGILLGGDIAKHNIVDVHQKSFIISDTNGRISNFVEKRVVSNIVCFGLYGFSSAQFFISYFEKVFAMKYSGEIFVSQVVQAALIDDKSFFYREALSLNDWGIWNLWMVERRRLRTFFIDFDGVLVKNTGRYGNPNWDSEFLPIKKNMLMIKKLYESGAQIILTTSRPSHYEKRISSLFQTYGIIIFSYVFGLNHSERVILNDYSDSNPFPSASALNIIRNGDLTTFSDTLN
jgi:hypothetical protein